MSGYETAAERGFLLSVREWQVIGGATALMTLNVLVMLVFVETPLAAVNDVLFSYPIVGVLVYGAGIVAGQFVAERGVRHGNLLLGALGVAILQLAFGTFGAGVLVQAPVAQHVQLLGLTAVIVALLTAVIGTYVYARSNTTFEHYNTWSIVAFLAGIVVIAVGTVVPVGLLLLIGFVCLFVGFLFRLGWEMWQIRDGRTAAVSLQAIGLYIAVAGVFVHVLQLVVRFVADDVL